MTRDRLNFSTTMGKIVHAHVSVIVLIGLYGLQAVILLYSVTDKIRQVLQSLCSVSSVHVHVQNPWKIILVIFVLGCIFLSTVGGHRPIGYR